MTLPNPIPFKQSPNYHAGRKGQQVRWLVIHAMAGFWQPTIDRFMNSAIEVSAHYLIGQQGQLLQMVRETDEAWACCDANGLTISIEHEDKNLCMKQNNWWTNDQIYLSIDLAADICKRYNLPVTAIIGHNDPVLRPFRNNHTCPGYYWPMQEYRAAVAKILNPVKPTV